MPIPSFQHLDKLKSSFSNLHAIPAMLNLSQPARHPFTVLSRSLATRHPFAVLSHFLTIRYSWPCQVFLQLPDTPCPARHPLPCQTFLRSPGKNKNLPQFHILWNMLSSLEIPFLHYSRLENCGSVTAVILSLKFLLKTSDKWPETEFIIFTVCRKYIRFHNFNSSWLLCSTSYDSMWF